MMGKILLTEASGYIGSHLKDKLKVNHLEDKLVFSKL